MSARGRGSNKRHKEIMADAALKQKICKLYVANVSTKGLLSRFSITQGTLNAITDEANLPRRSVSPLEYACPGDRP